MEQILLHLIGDYVTQSHWMAENKTKTHAPALIHASVYGLPFLLIGSPIAVLVIFATHFLIDRYRLARYIVWAKNRLFNPAFPVLTDCPTGYPPESPAWLSVWLLIVADNTLHLVINYSALRWL
jgi:hypothetical protein